MQAEMPSGPMIEGAEQAFVPNLGQMRKEPQMNVGKMQDTETGIVGAQGGVIPDIVEGDGVFYTVSACQCHDGATAKTKMGRIHSEWNGATLFGWRNP